MLGEAPRHETAGAAAPDDIPVIDELAKSPVDSVPSHAQILRKRSARWQPGVQCQRTAGDRSTDSIADPRVSGLVDSCVETRDVYGKNGP